MTELAISVTRLRIAIKVCLLVLTLSGLAFVVGAQSVEQLPSQLTDAEFWKLSSNFSEPDGYFRSDNLLSNETWFQYVIPDLLKTAKPGRVYMGVGPEQNFTYIAALQPKMAFIVDIRRGNLHLHLMYKALFELSKDRAEFVSRLFSKPRPEGLGMQATVREIFNAYSRVETSEELYKENLKAITDHLIVKRGLKLSYDDVSGIEYVFNAFHQFGPTINYSSSSGGFGGGFGRINYAGLMTQTDEQGQPRSYLANEENFLFLKALHTKNMLVPVVGNFAGPKAIRAIAKYLKDSGVMVSAFYLSNVEQYLMQDGLWQSFCGNAATLPLDETSTFIRSVRGGAYGTGGGGLSSDLGNMVSELKRCIAAY